MFVRLVFEGGLDEDETIARGYRSHVVVELSDGSHHPITFYDLARLSQELAAECSSGRNFFAEPNLVVVPLVTLQNMEAAARALAAEGFFTRT